jgi:hypothetical protein
VCVVFAWLFFVVVVVVAAAALFLSWNALIYILGTWYKMLLKEILISNCLSACPEPWFEIIKLSKHQNIFTSWNCLPWIKHVYLPTQPLRASWHIRLKPVSSILVCHLQLSPILYRFSNFLHFSVFVSPPCFTNSSFASFPFCWFPLVMEFCSFLFTWPSDLNCLCLMVVIIHCWPVLSKRSLFDILLGQYILTNFYRQVEWNPFNLWLSFCVSLEHSEPYKRIDRMLLWYSRTLILAISIFYLVDERLF